MQLVKWREDFTKPWLGSVLSAFIRPQRARPRHPMQVDTTRLATRTLWRSRRRLNTEKLSVFLFCFLFFKEGTSWATNHNTDLKKGTNKEILKKENTKKWHHRGPSRLCCSIDCVGGTWAFLSPGGDGAGLRADVGSHSCSCQVSSCCDGAYTRPDRGPGSPGRGPDARGYAASQTTCGCVPCAPARCGDSPPTSSGCGARWKWNGRRRGCSVAFFGSAG